MKNYLLTVSALASCGLLAACGNATVNQSKTLINELKNPLFAERYYEDLIGTLVNIEIREPDTAAKESALISKLKNDALEKAKEQTRIKRSGVLGRFVAAKQTPEGPVLLVNNTLYFGTDFITEPGPSLHVYLTKVVDPTQKIFPDSNALDAGRLESPYGAQSYTIKNGSGSYQTAVLYDTELKRLYGFAQLTK
ncbi:MAG: hypothetical protein JWM56_1099 [Candidatus Peribacteria bacterium]|nr:hypothetical protein [Candidatus Peribacteria bacterium]